MNREIFHQIIIGIVCNLLIVDCGLSEGWPTPTMTKFSDGNDPVKLSSSEEALVINLMYVGVGMGALSPIFLMDKIGRKWTLLAAALPKIISWIVIGLAKNSHALYAGRITAGIGCGIAYSVLPMYIGEVSTKRTRGPLGTLLSVLINIGLLMIYTIGLYVNRFQMAMMALVIPVLFFMTFIWLPESSVYLTRKKNYKSAEKSLKWSLGKDNVDIELDEIKKIVSTQEKDDDNYNNNNNNKGFIKSFINAMKIPGNRRSFRIMFILCGTLGLTGAAPILSYQSNIFKQSGFGLGSDFSIIITGCTIVIAGTTCVSIVKIIGKRKLLLIAAPIAVLSLAIVATFFTLLEHGVNVHNFNWIPIVFVVIYVFVVGLAFNPIPLAYLGEIFSFEVKVPAGICSSLYYAVSTTVTVKMYQILADNYGTFFPFWIFTGITFILWILIYLYVPETEGKSLAEIQIMLNDISINNEKSSMKFKSIKKIIPLPTTVYPTIN
ncbi:facilitated trehalose transporter Tret1-2 homolog [Aphidius gifuensis]|uniref:facilitated trehalose transporter Tret1-2 homolog n=1 Tax=Aphidius gifuensis TaxID=684658 RepID=UPI001CDD6C56|nr:facilitated trehalose transporter Tret1-2 homolog [Aphidius gifuensis]